MNGSQGLCNFGSVAIVPKNKIITDDMVKKNGYVSNKMAATEHVEDKRSSTDRIARECAYDIIHQGTGIKTEKLKPANTKYAKTLRRTVAEITEKHGIFLESAMRKLEITETTVRATIDNVANEMFVDQHFNWGRMVTLYAFCAKVAKYCADKYKKDRHVLVEKIADYTADYVAESLSTRIEQQGGWVSVVYDLDKFVCLVHNRKN